MVESPRVATALAGLSLLLGVVAFGFLASHASVETRSTGETFQCLASWDIVLNDAYNDPDGFPPLPGEYVGARCVTQAYRNFHLALGAGAAAAGLGLAATFVWVRARRTDGRERVGTLP